MLLCLKHVLPCGPSFEIGRIRLALKWRSWLHLSSRFLFPDPIELGSESNTSPWTTILSPVLRFPLPKTSLDHLESLDFGILHGVMEFAWRNKWSGFTSLLGLLPDVYVPSDKWCKLSASVSKPVKWDSNSTCKVVWRLWDNVCGVPGAWGLKSWKWFTMNKL